MSRIEAADRPMSAEEHHPTNGEERRSTGTEHTDAAEPASVDTDDPAGNGSMRTDDPTASGAVRADEPTGASRADSAAARLGADKMASRSDEGDAPEALIPANRSADYRARWDVVKGQFVDDPRSAERVPTPWSAKFSMSSRSCSGGSAASWSRA